MEEQKVRCSKCGWTGTTGECGFGHDDFYCPICRVESLEVIKGGKDEKGTYVPQRPDHRAV